MGKWGEKFQKEENLKTDRPKFAIKILPWSLADPKILIIQEDSMQLS